MRGDYYDPNTQSAVKQKSPELTQKAKDASLVRMVNDMFSASWRDKEPHVETWKECLSYYLGYHWDDTIYYPEWKSKLVYKPLPADDPRQRQPDITLAKNHLRWQPTVPLREGLEKTIEWFRTINLNHYRPPTPNYS